MKKVSSRRIIFFAVVLLCVLFAAALVAWSERPHDSSSVQDHVDQKIIVIKGDTLHVEIADTPQSRMRGLSGHRVLQPDSGMFFVFPYSDRHTFWMKDMSFPVDIIWIDSHDRIVHIEHSVQPETYPTTFGPPVPSLFVLEVTAGYALKHSLNIGDVIEIK